MKLEGFGGILVIFFGLEGILVNFYVSNVLKSFFRS